MSYCVIIPSHKRPEMLQRALRSVYSQTILPDVIYLVVDESEDSGSYPFLGNYDQRLNVTFTGGGYGGARARNVGLDLAEEEFVFFLDDDDEWLPTKVEEQLRLFDQSAGVVGVTCGRFECSRSAERRVVQSEHYVRRYYKLGNLIGGFSSFGFRRSPEVESLRLDGSLRSAQDYEFYLRLLEYGDVGVVEEPLIRFHLHDEARITTSSHLHRGDTLRRVLDVNRRLFTSKEYRFCCAKIELMTAFDNSNFTRGFLLWLAGSSKLVLVFSYRSMTLRLLRHNFVCMMGRLCKSLSGVGKF